MKRGEMRPLRVSNLLLDGENFRLPEDVAKEASQIELLKMLERDYDLNTIAESLIDNGYFIEEPLVVIKATKEKYIVIEGNRRLAALKFLTQPEFRKYSYQKSYWESAAKRLHHDLSEVPTITYDNRADLTSFLGFRHFAGTMKWDPLCKARFIYNIIKERGNKATYSSVAREIGSHAPTVRDNYIAYNIVIQARDDFEIDTNNLEASFSVFYRALSDPSITDYMGLDKSLSMERLKLPIPKKKTSALRDIIEFIHGTKDVPAAISDSRQLSQLGEILESREATDVLRKSRNLDQAYMLCGGEKRRLKDNLEYSIYYIREALKDAYLYKDDPSIQEIAANLRRAYEELLKHFPLN
jgi:hypothetical protein